MPLSSHIFTNILVFYRPLSRNLNLASPPPPLPPHSMRFYKREFQRLKDRPSDGNLSNETINETGNTTKEHQSKTVGRLSSFLRRDFHLEREVALVSRCEQNETRKMKLVTILRRVLASLLEGCPSVGPSVYHAFVKITRNRPFSFSY